MKVNTWLLSADRSGPCDAHVPAGLVSKVLSLCIAAARPRHPLAMRRLALVTLLGLPTLGVAADRQELFNFVRPLDAVQVTTQDAVLPSVTAESTPEGEILRRLTFNVADKPSLRLTPQSGSWDWSAAEAMSLRIQSAQDWAITVEVAIESADGKVLTSQVALPAGVHRTELTQLSRGFSMAGHCPKIVFVMTPDGATVARDCAGPERAHNPRIDGASSLERTGQLRSRIPFDPLVKPVRGSKRS